MPQLIRIGMDTSKKVFQLHAVDAEERVVPRQKLSRHQMIRFFERLPPTVIDIEACGASHHWARTLDALGHEVRLMAPQLVKPYVRRSKNDAADAEALCEAMSRPTLRFVPVKTVEQQAPPSCLSAWGVAHWQAYPIGQFHSRIRRRIRIDRLCGALPY